MGIRKEKKSFDQEECLKKHQDGAILKSEVSMETQRKRKIGEPTMKHILWPRPQDGVVKEEITIRTYQGGVCPEAEHLRNKVEDEFY